MRVLILSASAGDGHLSAARALYAAFSEAGSEARMVDALDCAPRLFRLWFCGGYEGLVRYQKKLWGLLYRWSDRPSLAYAVQTFMDDVFLTRLEGLITAERPDWIICTQALPLPRLARLAKAGRDYGVAVVVTDIHPHKMWLRGEADLYCVPDDRTRAAMEVRRPGIGRRTIVTGIPVHSAFSRAASLCGPVDTGPPCILLAAGGIGAGPLLEALKALISIRFDGSVTVICGRNPRAHGACMRLRETLGSSQQARLNVLGYVDQEAYASHLARAALFVGKPGGLTMAECLAVGVPLIVYRPLLIPGQEEDNARCLKETGCAIIADDAERLKSGVETLLNTPWRMNELRTAARRAGRPLAAPAVVECVLERTRDARQM